MDDIDGKHLTYNDGRRNGGRYPHLALIRDGEMITFSGESINKLYVVIATNFVKSGQWSNTTYTIQLAGGVGHLVICPNLHNPLWPDICRWVEVQSKVVELSGQYVELDSVKEYFGEHGPKFSARINEREALLKDLPEVEVQTFTFGAPTNRAIREGYWGSPKEHGGHTFHPQDGWHNATSETARVLGVDNLPGHHGGYYRIHYVVVEPEPEPEPEPEESDNENLTALLNGEKVSLGGF